MAMEKVFGRHRAEVKTLAGVYGAAYEGDEGFATIQKSVESFAEAEGLTMIFDEIDRGVGGATADAVGRRLEALAEGAQVLVVTHSPQVAARAAFHARVEKSVEDDATLSRVTALSDDDRVDEIARMLAGDRVTPEAREAARVLLRG